MRNLKSRSSETPVELAPPSRPATAHDVARVAGVSQSAVSRTFTEGSSVAPATRERVLNAARQLGYRPNLIARSLQMRRSNLVGVAVPEMANPFYPSILEHLSTYLGTAGYRVVLFPSRASESTDPILEEVLRYRLDALVLVSTSLSSVFADECQKVGLPVVLLNRMTASAAASSVTGDNTNGAATIARFLLASGHRRIAFIAGLESSSTSTERERAFVEVLAENGVSLTARKVANYNFEQAATSTRELLSTRKPPDAIFCANDHTAIAALSVARTEFGLTPGTDVSIVGFDDTRLASLPEFGLTTYRQPIAQMAEHAVAILKSLVQNPGLPATHETVPGILVVRTSARIPEAGIATINGENVWLPTT